MNNILNRLYYDYYNLNKKSYFSIDKDYLRLLFMLKDKNIENITVREIIKEYKNSYANISVNSEEKRDDYWIEKEVIHITYPFEETLERIEVLYNIVGKEMWIKVFKFDYKDLCDFIIILINRIYNYNYCHLCGDSEILKEYEKTFPYSKRCYFTRREIYQFFDNKNVVDSLFEFLSIDIKMQRSIVDSTKLIHYNDKYYLFFIWDFIYNLFNEIENKILENTSNIDIYYQNKGKKFENLCYEKLIKYYRKEYIYKNIKYEYKNSTHEIDLLLELPNSYIIFECKSSNFDINKINSNKELYEKFIKSFGRGYKTINDLNNYITMGNNEFIEKSTNTIIKLKTNKKIYYIILSLYNIEYLQTQIQKIKTEYIKPVNFYPICWNYMDFGSIMKLAPIDLNLFEKYLERRTILLNKRKNVTFDIDEMDVFGFLTDPNYDNSFEMIMKYSDNNIDERFMISNGIYRQDFNQMFNLKYISEYIESNNTIT